MLSNINHLNRLFKISKSINNRLLINSKSTIVLFNSNKNEKTNILNYQTRNFHSSNALHIFGGFFDKLKNKISPKTKEQVETEENDIVKDQPTTTTTTITTKETTSSNNSDDDYMQLLESDKEYDYNVFKESLVKYRNATTDQARIKDLNQHIKIIDSMTPEERANPSIFLKHAFKIKQRILKDSGATNQDFGLLVHTFDNARNLHGVLKRIKKQGKEVPNSAAQLAEFLKNNGTLVQQEMIKMKKEASRKR
ncbi:hypothetical protein DLAC_06250 [Tieghemostelium lacteum]|uniref:Signal recognition particle SRP54 subunit M-domain domain-containing protein n=1 Tax=Tieghemostelium lacteum TaxID=361077 RepID=A0A151ZI68_TIELA|nr:hypothetical protein DLAC_06250 [Tieghemostelium lacteum]|eukprot:KYQ93544.1 hypothetical protein DLAC_06250 [Tieghemostelium lacteum]